MKAIIGSIFALLLVALFVVMPGYIAGFLEPIETARSGITTTEEILSNSTSDTTYTPYMEGSDSNDGSMYWTNGFNARAHSILLTDDVGIKQMTPTFNYYEYEDYYQSIGSTSSDTTIAFQIYYLVDYQDWLDDTITEFHFEIQTDLTYHIDQITAHGIDSSGYSQSAYQFTFPTTWTSTNYYGTKVYETSFTTAQVTNAESTTGSYYQSIFKININLNTYDEEPIITDFQMNPEYFEETTTTYDNETVTTYEPYILGISSPFTWTKILLPIGAVLITGSALISTPFINPSEIFSRSRRRK